MELNILAAGILMGLAAIGAGVGVANNSCSSSGDLMEECMDH